MTPTPWQGLSWPWAEHPEWPADYEFGATRAPVASPPAYVVHEVGAADETAAVAYKYKGAYGGGKASKVFFTLFRWSEGGRDYCITRQDMAYAFSKLVGDWERVLLALHDVQATAAANKRAGRLPSADTQARHLAVVAWVAGVVEQAFWSIEHLAAHLDVLSRAEVTGAIPASWARGPAVLGDYVLRPGAARHPAPAKPDTYAFRVCADVVARCRALPTPTDAVDAGTRLLDEAILHPVLARAATAAFGVLKETADEKALGEIRRVRAAGVRRTNFAKRWAVKRPPPAPPVLPAADHALVMGLLEDAALSALGSPAPTAAPTLSSGRSVSSGASVGPRSPESERDAYAATPPERDRASPIYGALRRKAETEGAPPAPPLKSPSFAFGRH
ncbi:hypothetical protein Q8F55_003206 [Vanrija albida]|uniref:Uncharacterized protein n=1 Tax=Vanrija albida TaxID=181172 RepID=A0ABR3QBU2_9TREE